MHKRGRKIKIIESYFTKISGNNGENIVQPYKHRKSMQIGIAFSFMACYTLVIQ